MSDIAAEAAHAAVTEITKYGVAGAVATAALIGRLWLDARDARREREALRSALAAQVTATAGLPDLARAAAVEAMIASEAESRRVAVESVSFRLDRVEADVRAVDRAVALAAARADARGGQHG